MKKVFTLTKSIRLLLIVLFTSGLMISSQKSNAQFTAGNLALYVANGTTANATASVVEINTTSAGQSAINTFNLPGTFIVSASATSTMYAQRSNDGTQYVVLGATSNGNTATNANTLNPRIVGAIDNSGSFTAATTYTAGSGNQSRGASSLDNNTWYIGDQGGLYTNGGSSSILSNNFRAVKVFGGVVYTQTSTAADPVAILSNPPATSTLTALTWSPAAPTTTNLQDFYLVSSAGNNTYDIMYLLYASSATAGSISKYSLVSGTWTLNGSFTTTSIGGFGLCALKGAGSTANLYVTTGTGATAANKVQKIADAAGFNVAPSMTQTTVLYTTAAGTIIKGIDFAPVAGPKIAISTTSLTGFTYSTGSGPSPEQSFTVSGSLLTSDITITPSTDYWISTTSGAESSSPITLTQSGGNVGTTTIFVVLKSGLSAANYNNETIAATSTSAVTKKVTCSGSVTTPSPLITLAPASPATLSGYNYTFGGGPSTDQTFTISAVNLTAALTLNGLTNYEISTTQGSGYATSINLGSGPTVATTTIYARLKSGLAGGNYSETVTAASTGATSGTVALSGTVYSGAFTSGDLAVEVVGDGTNTLSSAADQVNVWEYNVSGVRQNAFAFAHAGTLPGSAPYNLTESGSATSGGLMGRSSEGSFDLVAGYNAVPLSASVVASTNLRTIGLVSQNGTLNSNNAYSIFPANNFRSIASNGFSFWAAGTVTGSVGLYYYFDLSTPPVSLGTVNTRFLAAFNGNLYYSTATTGGTGIYQIGTNGMPLSLANTAVTQLTDGAYAASGSSSPYEFSINPAGNVMYIADDASWVNGTTERGGIIKYTKSGSTWTYQYTLRVFTAATSGARGITVDWSGANPIIYATTSTATSNNPLVKIVDDGTGSAIGTILVNAGTNYAFRGVQFAPVTSATKTVFSTATQLDFGAEPISGVTTEQVFNASGYNLTSNLVVTAPTDYGVSLVSGGPYASSVSISGATVNAPIYVVFEPTLVGPDNGTLTIASTGATTVNVPVTGTGTNPVNYYNTANTDLTNPANWGTNTDGSGSNPSDFVSAGQVFNVVNAYNALTSPWAVSGIGSKIVVGDGLAADNLIAPAGFPVTGTVDVTANATLTLQDATYPTLGTLAATSTVVYNVNGTNTIPNATYGNLTLKGNTPASDICNLSASSSLALPLKVTGNFLVDGATVLGASVSPNTYMQLTGNLTGANGAIFGGNPPLSTGPIFSVVTAGNGNQIFSYPGGKINLYSLTSTKSAGIFTLGTNTTLVTFGSTGLFTGTVFTYSGTSSVVTQSGSSLNATGIASITLNFTGTASFTLGGNINTSDNSSAAYTVPVTPASSLLCNFGTGTTFDDGGNTLQVSQDLGMVGAGTYNLTGTVLIATRTGTSFIKSDATNGAIVVQLNNLTISPIAGGNTIIQPGSGTSTVVIKGNLTIGGTYTGFKLQPNNNLIQVGGNFTDSHTNDAIAAGTSTFEFNGTTPQTITTAFTSGESLFNVKINNTNGVQLAGAAGILNITSTGNLNVANGLLTTNSGKVILNNTATITESTTSYVVGTVTSTRTLTANTNQIFGGMGIEVDALGSAPGSTVATRVTGISSSLGCASSSILRYFTLAPATNSGLNATIVFHYLASNFELNGFTPSSLALFNSTNNGASWNSLVSTNNTGASTITVTGQASLNRYSAGNEQPIGGMVTPVNSIVCPSPNQGSVNLTALGATGILNWQSSTDNIAWSNINGATNATYTASPTVKTYYRLTATFSNCLVVASTTGIVEVSSPTITITASNITDNSVTLNWSPVGTGNYALSYTGTSSATQTSVTPSKTITGLSAGGTYNFTLTQTGASLSACSASGTLPGVNTLCGVPTGVTASSPAASQILVSWTGVPGADYRVYYRPLFSFGYYFTKDVIGASSVLLTKQGNNNLYASNTYELYVSRLNCPTGGAVGAGSNFLDVTTLPAVACATPVIDSVRSVCPVQLEVFIHHNPAVSDYNVYIQRETPSILAVNGYGISSDYFTINTPYSGEQYLIAVDARCSANSVSNLNVWPGNVTVKPLCNAPANLVLSSPTCHGFTSSWNADQCIANNASGYAIYLRMTGTVNFNSYGAGLPPSGLSPSKVVNWLTSGRNYQVFVRSMYSCNGFVTYGPASQTLSISTLSSGCRDEEDAPVQDETSAVQQTAPDNSEVLSLYPNPNNGQFEVNLSSLNTDDQQVRVEVMNMLGQTVVTHFSTIEAGHYNEYVKLPSNITSGTYIVRVTVGKNIYTSKINVSK